MRPLRSLCLLLTGLLTLSGAALALDDPLLEEILREVSSGDLDEARALLDGLGVGPAAAHRRELAELVIEVAELRAGQRPREEVLAHAKRLEDAVTPGDLEFLRAGQRAVRSSRSYLSPLVRAAYRAIGPRLPSDTLIRLARDPERRVRRLAVSALAEQIAPLREHVVNGGCLSQDEQRLLADPALIQLLIERLPERPEEGTDLVPADLVARTPGCATALHTLVLIEAAALPELRSQQDREGVKMTIAAIHSAVSRRLHRYPESTWFCADGEHTATHGETLEHCDRVLPQASRFCPHCGLEVQQVCATCGELVAAKADFCTSCGGAAADPVSRCSRCKAATPQGSAFCPQCGARARAETD